MVPQKSLGQKGTDLKQNSPLCGVISRLVHCILSPQINNDFLKY